MSKKQHFGGIHRDIGMWGEGGGYVNSLDKRSTWRIFLSQHFDILCEGGVRPGHYVHARMAGRSVNFENVYTYLGPLLYGLSGSMLLGVVEWIPWGGPYTFTALAILVAGAVTGELSFFPVRAHDHQTALLVWLVWFLVRLCARAAAFSAPPESALESVSHFFMSFVLLVGLIGCAWSTTLPVVQASRVSLGILFTFAVKLSALVPVQTHPGHGSVFSVSIPTILYFFLSLFSWQYIEGYLEYPPKVQPIVFILHTAWVLAVPSIWWMIVLPVAVIQGVFYQKMTIYGRVIFPRHRAREGHSAQNHVPLDEWSTSVLPLSDPHAHQTTYTNADDEVNATTRGVIPHSTANSIHVPPLKNLVPLQHHSISDRSSLGAKERPNETDSYIKKLIQGASEHPQLGPAPESSRKKDG